MPPCGRSACTMSADVYKKKVNTDVRLVEEWRAQDKYRPSFNLSPGMNAPVLYTESGHGLARTVMHTMKWGLIPSFGPVPVNMSNARSETLREKPCFRNLLNTRRCVVLFDGFYEWQKTTTTKKPFFIRFGQGLKQDASDAETCSMLAMAGLYDVWHDKEANEVIHSFTIITTDAAKDLAHIHDRMPAILPNAQVVNQWLDCHKIPFDAVAYLLRPYEGLSWYRVAPLVGSIRNNTPECMKLFDATSGIGQFFSKKEETEQVKVEPKNEKAEVTPNLVHTKTSQFSTNPYGYMSSPASGKACGDGLKEDREATAGPSLCLAQSSPSSYEPITPKSPRKARWTHSSPGSKKRRVSGTDGQSTSQKSISCFFNVTHNGT